MPKSPATLQSVLASRVQGIREQDGRTQEQLAAALRGFGWKATRATVAKVETGHYRLGLEELIPLALALRRPLADFVAGDWLGYAPESSIRGDALQALLQGASGGELTPQQVKSPKTIAAGQALSQVGKRWERVAKEAEHVWPDASLRVLVEADEDTASETVQVAARALGITPLQAALLARRRWGHSLVEHRDRLADEGAGSIARGHVTRRLIKELRPDVP